MKKVKSMRDLEKQIEWLSKSYVDITKLIFWVFYILRVALEVLILSSVDTQNLDGDDIYYFVISYAFLIELVMLTFLFIKIKNPTDFTSVEVVEGSKEGSVKEWTWKKRNQVMGICYGILIIIFLSYFQSNKPRSVLLTLIVIVFWIAQYFSHLIILFIINKKQEHLNTMNQDSFQVFKVEKENKSKLILINEIFIKILSEFDKKKLDNPQLLELKGEIEKINKILKFIINYDISKDSKIEISIQKSIISVLMVYESNIFNFRDIVEDNLLFSLFLNKEEIAIKKVVNKFKTLRIDMEKIISIELRSKEIELDNKLNFF